MLFACTRPSEHQHHPLIIHLAKSIVLNFQVVQTLVDATPLPLRELLGALSASLEEVSERYNYNPYLSAIYDPLTARLLQALQPIWQCHKLLVTSEGHSGLGPEIVQPGDVVAIIAGCEYPAILRPYKDWFFFVGNAYVSDVPYSDIMRVWNAEEEDLQLFELR